MAGLVPLKSYIEVIADISLEAKSVRILRHITNDDSNTS